ncbi:MAG: nucleotidyltransferase domain-containing protein [Christensenellaceae bacterium]
MMLTVEKIKEVIAQIAPQYAIASVVLFGSYAKGCATEKSDVDLLIDSNGSIKGIEFFGLLEAISERFDERVDLIEKSQIMQGSPIYNEIQGTGVIVYGYENKKCAI